MNVDVRTLEQERIAGVQTGLDQILHDLLLPVDRDPAAPGQLVERNSMRSSVKSQLDPVMDETLPLQSFARTHLHEKVRGRLLEHPRSDSLLDVIAAAGFEHDRIDAVQVKQLPEHEPGRPGPHYPDLRTVNLAHLPPGRP